MRKMIALLIMLFVMTSCMTPMASAEGNVDTPNVLIVFFSRHGSSVGDEDADAASSASLSPGDMVQLTETIHAAVGGDLFQIVTVDPYPKEYRATTDLAAIEQNDNSRPALATTVENMDDYGTIFLGYPNWWGTLPMAVMNFLESYDFSGKTIIPFCSHEGSGLGRSITDLTALCPDATILDGLAVRGRDTANAQTQVDNWLENIGYER